MTSSQGLIIWSSLKEQVSWVTCSEMKGVRMISCSTRASFLEDTWPGHVYCDARRSSCPYRRTRTGGKFREMLFKIENRLHATAKDGSPFRPFLLWQGSETAVADLIAVKEDGELCSMGIAAFRQKWKPVRGGSKLQNSKNGSKAQWKA